MNAIEALDRCTKAGAVLVKMEALSLLRVNKFCCTDEERKKNTKSHYLSTDRPDYSPERINRFAMGANGGQKLPCMYGLLSVNRRYFKWRSEVCKEIQVAEKDLEWRQKY
jgi:hypothetical protein